MKSKIKNIIILLLFISCIYMVYILWFERLYINIYSQNIPSNIAREIFIPTIYIPDYNINISLNLSMWIELKEYIKYNIENGLYSFEYNPGYIRIQYVFEMDYNLFLDNIGIGYNIFNNNFYYIYIANSFDFLDFYIDFQKNNPDIKRVNFIGDFWLSTIQPFVDFFFPNPNAINTSIINNIYTYHDNSRIVRFYPDYFVEYNSTLSRFSSFNVGFFDSLSRAFEIIERDRESMYNLGHIMSDVFLVGYNFDEDSQIFSFMLDYSIYAMPYPSYNINYYRYRKGIYDFAIKIKVLNNNVIHYRRFMINLEVIESS